MTGRVGAGELSLGLGVVELPLPPAFLCLEPHDAVGEEEELAVARLGATLDVREGPAADEGATGDDELEGQARCRALEGQQRERLCVRMDRGVEGECDYDRKSVNGQKSK
jgi:hypothetical protein